MRKNVNTEHIEGRLYSLGEANGRNMLEIKVTGEQSKNPGTTYIAGTVQVAVDEDGLNVIPVHFTYVTEATKNGGKNGTFTALKKIIEEGSTWVDHGKDAATKVKIDTALALNEFYLDDATRGEVLVSTKTNEGGFLSIVNELCPEVERNTFKMDMVITNVTHVEADEEKKIAADYTSVNGAVFNFRNELLPVEFLVKNAAGMSYFESLGVTNAEPIYTKVWGRINCETKISESVEESAFGEAAVRTYERKTREWVITGTAKEPYEFGDENVMTVDELITASQNRQVYLADIKKKAEEWKANKATPTAAPVIAPIKPKAGGFSF